MLEPTKYETDYNLYRLCKAQRTRTEDPTFSQTEVS